MADYEHETSNGNSYEDKVADDTSSSSATGDSTADNSLVTDAADDIPEIELIIRVRCKLTLLRWTSFEFFLRHGHGLQLATTCECHDFNLRISALVFYFPFISTRQG